MNDDVLNLMPAFPQEAQHWSPIDQLQSGYTSAISEHAESWPMAGDYREGLHLSAIPPLGKSPYIKSSVKPLIRLLA